MIIDTKDFGKIEISEKDIIFFPRGLYGFENFHKFVLLDGNKKNSIFKWLQCVETSELRFVVIDPLKILRNYNIPFDVLKSSVCLEDKKNLRLLAVTTVTAGAKEIYVNLKCPIAVNTRNNTAAQVILDTEDYPLRYYIKRGN